LKIKTGWTPDGQRIITPPLRTSSANGMNQNRTAASFSTIDILAEEKENVPQTVQVPVEKPQKNSKWGKVNGKNRAVVAEGIRNLFR